MSGTLKFISPVDGSIYAERPLASWAEVDGALNASRAAQAAWKRPLLVDLRRTIVASTARASRKED